MIEKNSWSRKSHSYIMPLNIHCFNLSKGENPLTLNWDNLYELSFLEDFIAIQSEP